MRNVRLTEICKKCAECCKNNPFIDLSAKEIDTLEQATGLTFDAFTNAKKTEPEEYFMQFQENGNCVFLKETDGGYFCSVYEARPTICKNYPSRAAQEDYCEENCKKYI